jgi:CBS domain-containing protein
VGAVHRFQYQKGLVVSPEVRRVGFFAYSISLCIPNKLDRRSLEESESSASSIEINERNFMKEPPAILSTFDTLKVAAHKFDETKAWNLPVVDENRRFVGFISRSGLFNSYRKTLVDLTAE